MTSLFTRPRIALLVAAFVLLLAPVAMADVVIPTELQPTPAEQVEIEEATPAPVATATPAAPIEQKRTGGDDADVTVTGTSDRTVWAGGRNVTVDSTSVDALAGGESVNLTGAVQDNFFGAGRLVQINGPVGGDVFLAGETVEIRQDVDGDVYAIAETVRVPADVTVGGNVYFGGALLDLDGTVEGDLVGGGADVLIDGTVRGDVRIDASNLEVGASAVIDGDLVYESLDPSSDIEGIVGGDVQWTATEAPVQHESGSDAGSWVFWNLFFFFGALIAGFALLLLFPQVLKRPTEILETEWPVSLGVGFAVLIGVPVLAIFLAIFLIPAPLSALAMAIWLPATYVARLVAAYAVGKVVLERRQDGKVAKPLGALAVGMVILHLLYAIPYLGGLLLMVATVFGLGALFLAARRASARGAVPSAA